MSSGPRGAPVDVTACDSPLNANTEPFLTCIKESKGLPLHTAASGSGASVGAGAAVVSGSVPGGSVAGTPCPEELCRIGGEAWAISRTPPCCCCCCCRLLPKSSVGGCVGLAQRRLAGEGEGVEAQNSSSSSSAITNVSPRAGKEKRGGGGRKATSERTTDNDSEEGKGPHSAGRTRARSQSSSSCSTCTWSHTGTASGSRSHSHSGPDRTLGTEDRTPDGLTAAVYCIYCLTV